MDLDVPELVRRRAIANGDATAGWLRGLVEVVRSLASQWDLTIGGALRGGTAAFVCEATDASGRACVLKVPMPIDADAFRRSVLVHQLAAGRGCATLLASSASPPAMLLERLGPNLAELGMAVPDILTTVAATLRAFWQPIDPSCPLPSGADQAAWLAGYVVRTWEELGRPCPRDVIDRAVSYCDERAAAFDPARSVLVHGDAHGWNTLAAGAGTYKFVDPEELRSDPAHDLGVLAREYNEPLLHGDTKRLARDRADALAASCDVEPEAVWQWSFVERVSTGLVNLRDLGGAASGEAFLDVAARCL